MMHAKIIETPTPEEIQAQADQAFAQCLEQLSSTDRAYYRRRAEQELEAVRSASCCEARIAHEELARAYRLLCSSSKARRDAHLASEMAMFQFNARPAD